MAEGDRRALKAKLGFLTIGESPRNDVVPEILRSCGCDVDWVEKGALDGLSGEERERLRPGKTDFGLITRLRHGSTAIVGKKKILPLLRSRMAEFRASEVRVVALLCTDEFAPLRQTRDSEVVLLEPWELLRKEVAARLEGGRLGVFVPLEKQKAETRKKWEKTGLRVFVQPLNPYEKSRRDLGAIERMRSRRVGLIVLDCIGYSGEMKARVERRLGVPVLLPREVLAAEIRKRITGRKKGPVGEAE